MNNQVFKSNQVYVDTIFLKKMNRGCLLDNCYKTYNDLIK